MGQKVNPHGLRVGVIKDWDSLAGLLTRQHSAILLLKITTFVTTLRRNLYAAGVPRVEIERFAEG